MIFKIQKGMNGLMCPNNGKLNKLGKENGILIRKIKLLTRLFSRTE